MDNIVIFILAAVLFGGLGTFVFFTVRLILRPQVMSNLGNLVKQGKNVQAIRTAKKLLQKEPGNTETHYLLGKALLQDGKHELALMEYKKVNDKGVFHGECKETQFRKEIADLFMKFGQEEEALKEFLLLVSKEPEDAEHLYMAGTIFERRKKPVQALSYFKKAISVNPQHSESHLHLGILLYMAKKESDAKTILEKSLKMDATCYPAYYYLGKLNKDQKNYTAAIDYFEKGQKDSDFKIKCLIERGICFIMIKNIDMATTDLERVLRLAQTEKIGERELLYARYFAAMCYEKTRKIDDALEQWEAIFTKDKNFKDVAEKLSQFQELRSDDVMKDYMTATSTEFQEICTKVVTALNHKVTDVQMVKLGCRIFVVESDTNQWKNARKFPKMMLFLRSTATIDLTVIRDFHEDMTKFKVTRGMMFAGTQFSRTALDFTESRPIDIYDKTTLLELLRVASKL